MEGMMERRTPPAPRRLELERERGGEAARMSGGPGQASNISSQAAQRPRCGRKEGGGTVRSAPLQARKAGGGGARGKTKKRPGRSPQLRSSSVPPAPLSSPPDPCDGRGRSRKEDKRKERAELPPAPHTMGTANSAPHRTRPIGQGRRSRKGDLTKAKADLPAVPCSVGPTSSTEWALAPRAVLSRICKPPA